jgi:seipin
VILLGLAVVAYGLFYFNYVPQIGIERVIHLQYGYCLPISQRLRDRQLTTSSDGPHPYGITCLESSLISQQAYDVSLTLHVPRSPSNLETGNFMLALTLLSPNHNPSLPPTASPPSTLEPEAILFTSRRPTLLPYTSPLISLSSRLVSLPLYILGLKSESELLSIPMAELLSFPKGWKNIPAYAMLELRAGQNIQVYDVRVSFKARFSGIRWVMYQHRFLAFVGFTGLFWGAECVSAVLAWVVIQRVFAPKEEQSLVKVEEEEKGDKVVKEEENTDEDPDLSDTPRTFPTSYWRQPPLRYEPKIKDKEYVLEETAIQPLDAEADDEDEDDEEEIEEEEEVGEEEEGSTGSRGRSNIDSGIGTSFSEGVDRGGVTRRSRGGETI